MPASILSVATLSAAAFVAALLIAPLAGAVPECVNTGPTTTQCQRPGNAQISTSPPVINDYPFGWPWWGNGSTGISINIGGIFG